MKVIGLLILLIVAGWVFSDAKSRGKSTVGAFIWSLLTFMLLIVFLPLWLIVRPKKSFGVSVIEKPTLCVNCGKYYEGIPSFCPNCGKAMRDHSST